MTQLMLVEDDQSLGSTLKERLEREGYSVFKSETIHEALAQVLDQYDLFILDVGLPDGSGFDLAKQIRSKTSAPFIFVTAQSHAEARLKGYEMGCEEYIPKPFHLKELLLRVNHVLQNHRAKDDLHIEDVSIEFGACRLRFDDGKSEAIPFKDMEILKFLITSSPKVLSRDEILDEVWGHDKFPTNRTVDNAILRLRQVLGLNAGRAIRSVRGIGYQWEGPK